MPTLGPQQQALLKRNPSMTQAEFSEAWLRHGALVLPWFLSYGYQSYAQVHGPLSSTNQELQAELHNWDGAAQSIPGTTNLSEEEKAWRNAYYQEVILPDERRFLVSEALNHLKIVEGVTGKKIAIIKDGKAMVDIPEDIMAVWRIYEAKRGIV